ncbi:ATP-binding protein [Noviherbaspirillum saxi]|uniref:ATP-binding protein n=2 Tax=Noviherbaspirillum saxi TaxID=2320863 RepID=A0A3A3G0Y2_9BURK|nr:ATP-binding protein [Noviherbaspirillum saxi]
MRDNGYKNAAHALAELMDNAIQAGATRVELLCGEQQVFVGTQRRTRISEIAVLDNGKGMDAEVLQMALQFGNGTHLKQSEQMGMGKFGMGLPASSISQCRRVDVWSWTDGPDNALHTYLDLGDIEAGTLKTVPDPAKKPIPDVWRKVGKNFGKTGTLVLWSQIDRCLWKTAKTLMDNSELLIGRMYRKFLHENKASIRLVGFDYDRPQSANFIERSALPNDPGYLMAPSSTPAPYNDTPMFNPWGGEDLFETTETIRFRGADHVVKVRFSLAKEEARKTQQAGALPYGKHARQNVGVSIVRADRELDLDQSFVIQYDPRERWWGVEVQFPPALDELFGVTNNKQQARNFSEIAQMDVASLTDGGKKTLAQVREELDSDDDPRAPLLSLATLIDSRLSHLRRTIEAQTKNTRGGKKRYIPADPDSPEQEATEKTKERQTEGHRGQSDAGEKLPPQQKQTEIESTLVNQGVPEQLAHELAANTVKDSLKYVFVEAAIDSPAFFSVQPKGGALIITLNTTHPAYPRLVDVLENGIEEESADISPEEVAARLNRALDGLKLLLMAWARYEDEQTDGPLRQRAQDARLDWGRIARRFLQED